MSIPEELREWFQVPRNLVLWVGAGISIESRLPSGDQLTDVLLERIFKPFGGDLKARIASIYQRLYGRSDLLRRLDEQEGLPPWSDGQERALPRLEFVLDRIAWVLGTEFYRDLLDLFGQAEPNSGHRWLAGLANQGAQIITANLDTLIEGSGAHSLRIYHYHGTFESSDPGAVLHRIALGFDNDVKDALEKRFAGAQAVVFMGYSGRDYYDVAPFLSVQNEKVYRAAAVWIQHDKRVVKPFFEENPPKLEYFRRPFASFKFCRYNTPLLHGGQPNIPHTDWLDHVRQVFAHVEPQLRRRLALDLTASMGLDQLGLRLLARTDADKRFVEISVPEQQLANEQPSLRVLYNASRYRTVLRRLSRLGHSFRKRGVDPMTSIRHTLLRRRYEASCSLYGLLLHVRLVRVYCRAMCSLQEVEKGFPTSSVPLELLDDQVWAVSEELAFLFQLWGLCLSVLPKIGSLRWLRRIFERKLNRCRSARRHLYERYIFAKKMGGQYNEELAQTLRTEWLTGSGETQNLHQLSERWVETDNLKQVLITQRQEIRARTVASSGIKHSARELGKWIHWGVCISSWYELVFWLALADYHRPKSRSRWSRYRRLALSHLREISWIGRRMLCSRAAKMALSGD